MRTSQHLVIVAIEVEVIRLVRVRAYRRVRFGMVEESATTTDVIRVMSVPGCHSEL